jgi:hypothetical protein
MKGVVGMLRELTEKDFARGVRNPHYEKIMTKVELAITKEDLATFDALSKLNGISPELIMRNCLADMAEEIREEDLIPA